MATIPEQSPPLRSAPDRLPARRERHGPPQGQAGRRPRAATWLLLPLLLAQALPAQAAPAQAAPPAPPADLVDLLAPIRERHGAPALGAAVLVDGKLAALGVTGRRRAGHDEAVTAEDLWHLGSCTKAMTATLLARLVEAGKVRWTTTVAEGLPDLAASLHEGARAITLRQLLSHRAGLPNSPPPDLWRQLFEWPGSTRDARTEVCKRLLAAAPEAAPGERFLYSNASYMVAGAIAERAGGAPWEELMQRELFAPLGITRGGFGPPGRADGASQPWGHRPGTSEIPGKAAPVPVFADNPPSLGPAGTVHMTLADWAKFVAVHLGEPGAAGAPLLGDATLQALHAPPAGDYALGWRVTTRRWAPGAILTHNGSNTMWYCVAWLAPAAKFAVLVTCNVGDARAACDEAAWACIQRFRPAAR